MPRRHPATGMVFVRSLQIGGNWRRVLLFCNWKALTVLQRYAQQAVMRSWSGSATSPPSQEGSGHVFELRVITRF